MLLIKVEMPWCLNCEMEIKLLCLTRLGIYQNECFCIDQKWVSANWLRFTSAMSLSALLYVKAAKLHISKIWSSFTKQLALFNGNIFDTVVVTRRKKKVGDEWFSRGKLTADDIWIENLSNTHCPTKQAHKQNSIFKTLDTFRAFTLVLHAFRVAQCALLKNTALSECVWEREELG